ncbi:hypothetical protein KUCAC02_008814 [Chaenocephalus aceratus]|uniref:Uncharacterized protein n=1 Tax=Chaenocephalus aceratus TaxID=36190 RepID=A0ACB9WSH5_CHAAC|nr:hypothetical protein KUCAC02_008814 [Chaenocephalus aceratus]
MFLPAGVLLGSCCSPDPSPLSKKALRKSRTKSTGAICVNSREPEELLENRVNKQELELLNTELQKQRRQIEALQQLIQVDGGVVNEVKLLRKESRNMNSRVTQLYMQLLHEIIRKRDNALEASQLETRVLNHTNQMGTLGLRYSELEHKYQHLSALANNQSALLLHLEKHCQRGGHSYGVVQERVRPVHPRPPVMPPVQMPELSPGGYRPYDPQKYTRHTINRMNNEIQNDQNSKAVSPPLPTIPSAAYSFTSAPVGPFKDCLEAAEGRITPTAHVPPETRQDQSTDAGVRRTDGSVNFFRNWETYKQGFGNIDGEHWLGLENIYWLTNQAHLQAAGDSGGLERTGTIPGKRWRLADLAQTASSSQHWTKTTTPTQVTVAHYQKGGWWYNACAHSNMNGVWYRGGHYRSRYQDGVYWAEFRGGAYSLKKVTMMIRPNANTVH